MMFDPLKYKMNSIIHDFGTSIYAVENFLLTHPQVFKELKMINPQARLYFPTIRDAGKFMSQVEQTNCSIDQVLLCSKGILYPIPSQFERSFLFVQIGKHRGDVIYGE